MKFLITGLAVVLGVVFTYLFVSKYRSRGTIALHRHPEDTRRGWRDPIDIVTTGGIPIFKNEAPSHYLKPYIESDIRFSLKAHTELFKE